MEIEKQVVSLELAKKLKELGYPQKGLWWWREYENNILDIVSVNFLEKVPEEAKQIFNSYVAPTVAELINILPGSIKVRAVGEGEHGGRYWLYMQKETCFYAMNNGQTRLQEEIGNTTADALARMLICLYENNLIKREEG